MARTVVAHLALVTNMHTQITLADAAPSRATETHKVPWLDTVWQVGDVSDGLE